MTEVHDPPRVLRGLHGNEVYQFLGVSLVSRAIVLSI
jgi:hypothetical protein